MTTRFSDPYSLPLGGLLSLALAVTLAVGVPASASTTQEVAVQGSAALPSVSHVAAPRQQRLPVVNLRVTGPIPDEDKVTGRMVVRQGARTVYRGFMGIEIRGQSSRKFPKKSWSIELRDRAGDNRDARLLGMPADDDWALVSNYADKTLMRNALAYSTARWIGGYAPRTRFVEVRLNGRYQGVYGLVERLKLHEDRIAAGDRGQLVEWTNDNQAKRKGGADFRLPVTRIPILLEDPERSDLGKAARRTARRGLAAADRAMYAADWSDPTTGWRRHVRADSAIDFTLVNEFLKNHDGFTNSVYLTRPRAKSRWALGPVWDFDRAMGNIDKLPSTGTGRFMLRERPWAERLYADPQFAADFAARWRELRAQGIAERMLADVDVWAGQLKASGASGRNFDRWQILGTVLSHEPAEAANRTTYSSEVRALKAWLTARIAWMDANVDNL